MACVCATMLVLSCVRQLLVHQQQHIQHEPESADNIQYAHTCFQLLLVLCCQHAASQVWTYLFIFVFFSVYVVCCCCCCCIVTGVIVNAELPPDKRPKLQGAAFNGPPTRVLVLRNMVGPGEVDEDLEEEVRHPHTRAHIQAHAVHLSPLLAPALALAHIVVWPSSVQCTVFSGRRLLLLLPAARLATSSQSTGMWRT